MAEQTTIVPRVLIFPVPLQGDINAMLKLAELLCLSNLHVTFLNSHNAHARLLRYTNVQARFNRFPGFRFETISDGLPEDHPRTGDRFLELLHAMNTVTKPLFEELLTRLVVDESESPVSWIIADGAFVFALDVAERLGIKLIFSRPINPHCLWTFHCIPQLIGAGEIPLGKGDLDRKIGHVPGMESFLRARDLPNFLRDIEPSDPLLESINTETSQAQRAHGLILNTFEELDSPILSHLRSQCPNIYTLGPIHALLKSKLSREGKTTATNSLRKEDNSCMAWLNTMPSKSVLYVSFGSLTVLSRDQLLEFWHGLANSGQPFLWVMRPDCVIREKGVVQIPSELSEATQQRGYIVEWAPQEDVLSHPAVGGFLTHSGWNSVLESMVAGVPMVCWPYFADHPIISRYVDEVWKLGLDMKDSCDRVIIEKMVRDLMDGKEKFFASAKQMKELAREAVSERGSSSCHLDRLIKDIKSMGV